jgi:putative Mg2+ transporter-C (MgtC) family protein
MLLAKHEASHAPASLVVRSRVSCKGIGFLGGAVIFKGGTDVRGIKTAAVIWITGAIGMSIGTGFWWLGGIVGILFAADRFAPQEDTS